MQQAAKKVERQKQQAAEQKKRADKQAKKVAKQKKSQQPISVGEKTSVVISNKPVVYKDVPQLPKTEGTIQTPSSARQLLIERDGKYYFLGTELPQDYRSISIYGESVATKAQAVAYIKQTNPEVKLACTVEELVELYWLEAEREQVRPDLALACRET